jgi:hypothetical protein
MLPLIVITLYYSTIEYLHFFDMSLKQLSLLNYPHDRIILNIYSNPIQTKLLPLLNLYFPKDYYSIFHNPNETPINNIIRQSLDFAIQYGAQYILLLSGDFYFVDNTLINKLISNKSTGFCRECLLISRDKWDLLSNINDININELSNELSNKMLNEINEKEWKLIPKLPNPIKNDLYCFYTHRWFWEEKYLDPVFLYYHRSNKIDRIPNKEPIPHLFEFPFLTPEFCHDLINEMNEFGKWSNGDHQDNRIAGGYENVPTQDIHLWQIGFDKIWKTIIKEYIHPWARYCYPGIQDKGTNLDFVVKYSTTGQTKLEPHHDSSSYSLNIALNNRNKDFQGGGTRFIKTGYYHTNQKIGWCLMHPGRVTHYHEGVAITEGTRYILVTFAN